MVVTLDKQDVQLVEIRRGVPPTRVSGTLATSYQTHVASSHSRVSILGNLLLVTAPTAWPRAPKSYLLQPASDCLPTHATIDISVTDTLWASSVLSTDGMYLLNDLLL